MDSAFIEEGGSIMRALGSSSTYALLLMLVLGACAQSRSGIGQQKVDKRFAPQEVCENIDGAETLGCFEVTLNVTKNEANIAVLDLGIDPMNAPYRVMARRATANSFTVLEDNVSVDIGGLFIVKPRSGYSIKEYVEWRFESVIRFSDNGTDFVPAAAGKGIPLAQVLIYFPELDYSEEENTSDNSYNY